MAKGTVLIVDDDPEVRAMLAEYLAGDGYVVAQAADGLEALLHVRRARPRAVVLDLMMPRLGGLEALKRIRALDPTIGVVVVTGVQDVELQRQALELGALAVFGKPISPEALAQALAPGERPTPAPRRAAARAPAPPVEGRILVVDDDPEVRVMLVEFCAEQDWEARGASDGSAGVRVIREWAPDVVLLDITMPGLSGVGALPAIFAVAPSARVIMVGGAEDVELSRRSLALGAFDYVTKPVDHAYLKRSIETALLMKRLDEAR